MSPGLFDRPLGADIAGLALLAGEARRLAIAVGRERAEDQVGLLMPAAMLDLTLHASLLPLRTGPGEPVESS